MVGSGFCGAYLHFLPRAGCPDAPAVTISTLHKASRKEEEVVMKELKSWPLSSAVFFLRGM